MTEETLFEHALQLPAAERAAFLDRECAGKSELRGRVEALLAADAASHSPLDHPVAVPERTGEFTPSPEEPRPASRWATDRNPDSQAGAVIAGKYTLVEVIGEGGMGSVWRAKQTEPVKRFVAVKLIKVGMDSKQVLARFEAERQALALMDHPNIAKVLDAGVVEAHGQPSVGVGRPFFVMELVKGVPITDYCDANKQTPPQRLELFVQACQAIQHAHQKGIIHRDIKPSNVLVALYDDKPVVKVIDFGVAKATGGTLTEATIDTGFGGVVGTPQYMSPEQATFNNLDIDTRSDVYALGVLLYELLAGSPPFSGEELKKKGFLEILRVVREEEPPRPSTKLSTADALPSLSANRGTEPKKLTGLLRNELDWIVMKALEKDRTRRYETANGFAADVQRYLAGEPVVAHPPSMGYRLKKFVRRNKAQVIAASVVLVALVAGVVGTSAGLVWAVNERDAKAKALEAETAERERAGKAEVQARQESDAKAQALAAEQKARQLAFAALRSMTDDVVERKFAQGATLTDDDKAFLRGVIAQFDAFAVIQGDDALSRTVRADGRIRVGRMRHRLGELKEAEADLNAALGIFKQLAANFPARHDVRQNLALSHSSLGNLMRETSRLKEAEAQYDAALVIEKQLAADFPARPEFRWNLARSHSSRGLLLSATKRLKEAEADCDAALGILKQLAADFPARPEFRQDLARTHTNRSNVLENTGRLKEAEADKDATLGIFKQLAADFPTRPEFRQDLGVSHFNRGNLLSRTGRKKEAEAEYDAALAIQKQLAADFPIRPEFRKDLARSLLGRGSLLRTSGRLKEAEAEYDAALAIQKQLAADHPTRPEFREDLASCHNHRGILLRTSGRLKEAEADYAAALGIYKQLAAEFPDQADTPNDVAGMCVNLAILHREQSDLVAAKRLLMEGRPYHLAALQANPRNPAYRQYYHNHLGVLMTIHAGLLEKDEAVRAAETRRDLGWNPPADAYFSAAFLTQCVAVVAKHDKLDGSQRTDAVQFYGDAALKLLREAVGRGFRDAAKLKSDPAFAPLRENAVFQKLLAELEKK